MATLKLSRPRSLPSIVDPRVDAIARQRVGGRIEEAFFVPGPIAASLDQEALFDAVRTGLGDEFEASFERPETLSFRRQGGLLRPSEVVGLQVEHYGSEGARVQLVHKTKRWEQWFCIGSFGFSAVVFGTLWMAPPGPLPMVAGLGAALSVFFGALATVPILEHTVGRSTSEKRLGELRTRLLRGLGCSVDTDPGQALAILKDAHRSRRGFSTSSRVEVNREAARRFDPRRVRTLMRRVLPGTIVDEKVEDRRVALKARRFPFQVPDDLEVELHEIEGGAVLETRQNTRIRDLALRMGVPLLLMLVLMGVATQGLVLLLLAIEIPVVSYFSLRWAQRMRERRLRAFERALLEDLMRDGPETPPDESAVSEPNVISTGNPKDADSVDTSNPVEQVAP